MKKTVFYLRRLLFLFFIACIICLCGIGIRYFGYTDTGRQTLADWKDMPRQWKQIEQSNKQTDQYYQGAQTLSGFDWSTSYSGTITVPKVLIPELYQTPRIKIPIKNIYDYHFTGFVVRNIGTGNLGVMLYGYNSLNKRPTFGGSIMRGVKNMVGELLLGLYDYRFEEGPYSTLGGISLPYHYHYYSNNALHSNEKCVQFINANHDPVIGSERVLPGCIVKLYNERESNFFHKVDGNTTLYVLLSFSMYYQSDTTDMLYSIEPMK